MWPIDKEALERRKKKGMGKQDRGEDNCWSISIMLSSCSTLCGPHYCNSKTISVSSTLQSTQPVQSKYNNPSKQRLYSELRCLEIEPHSAYLLSAHATSSGSSSSTRHGTSWPAEICYPRRPYYGRCYICSLGSYHDKHLYVEFTCLLMLMVVKLVKYRGKKTI